MRKLLVFLPLFFILFSQKAFSGELINLPMQESVMGTAQKQVVSPPQVPSSGPLIGFGSDALWRLEPGFEFKTTYDSNIHREPPGSRDEDIIFSYTPSIALKRSGTQLDVSAGYKMKFDEYLRNSDESAFNHIIETSINYKGTRLKATVDEVFSHIKTYATSEQSERRTIQMNDIRPEVAYRLTPKFSLAAVYHDYLFRYLESALEENSYLLNEYGGRIYYHVTPKLDFYTQGTAIVVDYYRSGVFDSTGFSVAAGLRGQMTRKLLVNVETGFKGQDYKDPALNSFNDWVLHGIIQHRLTPKLAVGLKAKRDKEESVYRNAGWYEVNSLGASLIYRITSHISFEAESSIQHNRYSRDTTEGTITDKRRDYILYEAAQLKWKPIRHLVVLVGYVFRHRASNFDNVFDLIVHTLDASISYQFS